MGGLRLRRISDTARPMALLSAMATLLAALFVCLGAAHAAEARDHHRAVAPSPALTASPTRPAPPTSSYLCPYDRGDCGLFPSLSAAVLTAPPLDPPLPAAAGLPRLAPPSAGGGAHRPGPPTRAPDLHVLQVLRT
ncbi:hypothetical protein GCM10014713_18440 [Streptomyces purpureus]|uniref:Uncharacterized protein n=2 Tax=Streptomyces purpureus TaxID=1951 RepID=A0A918H181_9ACTN|nr:hypothetical protein GCM10014713_18440 [Streptomyces purpureus]